MRQRLRGTDGVPMVYCFTTCRDSIRTIPVLQHDLTNAEDLDTSAEDHAADEWRYAIMSRPWVTPVERPMTAAEKHAELVRRPTFDEMLAEADAEEW